MQCITSAACVAIFLIVGVTQLGPVACLEARAPLQHFGKVMLLHDQNFDQETGNKPVHLVMFYAPWCETCRGFIPDFKEAAEVLLPLGVTLAMVDAVSEKAGQYADDNWKEVPPLDPFYPGTATAKKLDVSRYPTLKVFHYGRESKRLTHLPLEKDAIIEAMTIVARPASVELKSIAEVKETILKYKGKAPVALGFFPNTQEGHTFTALGDSFRGLIYFFHVRDQSTVSYFPALFHNTFVVLHHHSDDDWAVFGFPKQRKRKQKKMFSYLDPEMSQDKEEKEESMLKCADGRSFKALNDDFVVFERPVSSESSAGGKGQLMPLNREELQTFIANHGFSPVGVLTPLSRTLYNTRNITTLFMFLNFETEKVMFSSSSQREEEENAVEESSSKCHSKDTEEGESTEKCEGNQVLPKQRNKRRRLPQALKYYANRLKKVWENFPNVSFLLVNPEENPQVFRSFGFDWKRYHTSQGAKPNRNGFRLADNLIGVTLGDKKYKYPYDFFEPSLLEAFLRKIFQMKMNAFVKSASPPTGEAIKGEVVPVVRDTFDEIVLDDDKRDTLFICLSPYESLSTQVLKAAEAIARNEKDNSEFFVAAMDGTANDPLPDFEFEALPTIFYIRRSKKKFFQRISPNDDRAGYHPDVYKLGDYSLRSLEAFIAEHASVPLKNNKQK